jgi:hypothetical protein
MPACNSVQWSVASVAFLALWGTWKMGEVAERRMNISKHTQFRISYSKLAHDSELE